MFQKSWGAQNGCKTKSTKGLEVMERRQEGMGIIDIQLSEHQFCHLVFINENKQRRTRSLNIETLP